MSLGIQGRKDVINVPIYFLRRCYYTNTDAIIYVVDSADRYPHLHSVVTEKMIFFD
jgi:hypothetical protein